MVIWYGAENEVDDRARAGLYNEPLSVMSITLAYPNHLEQ